MAREPTKVTLQRTRTEILVSLRSFSEELARRIHLRSLILLGSWSLQDALVDSDIDILIVSDDFQGLSTLNRLYTITPLWRGPYPLEIFPHTTTEMLDGITQGTLHILDALDHGQTIHDDGVFKQLQAFFQNAVKTGMIKLTSLGWKYEPQALKQAQTQLGLSNKKMPARLEE